MEAFCAARRESLWSKKAVLSYRFPGLLGDRDVTVKAEQDSPHSKICWVALGSLQ
jgi:hypothetical protein